MSVKAKSSKTPYPLWIEGEYITKPPIRPCDGAIRPEGHYIDKGGYPGANVYEVDINTLCRGTGCKDSRGKEIYEKDLLLLETEEEIAYFVTENTGQVVDIISGEILEVQQLVKENIKVIGSVIDSEEFIESMQWHYENGKPIPYVPVLSVQLSGLPYMRIVCDKCNSENLSCMYMARCPNCGSFATVGYATKVYREKRKVLA